VELGIASSMNELMPNLSGVSYYLPARLRLETLKQIFPDLKKYLLLLQKFHPSSITDHNETEKAASELGLFGESVFCANMTEVLAAVQGLTDKNAVIILGSQGLIFNNAKKIVQAAGETPVYSYSDNPIQEGALGGVVADDKKLGQMLGAMLIDVLVNGRSITDLPIQMDPEPRLRLNSKVVEKFHSRISFAVHSLSHTEQMLDSVLRSAPTGIGVVENRVLVQVNDYILKLTGYSEEELIGQNIRMLYPTQEDYDYVGNEKYRQMALKGIESLETRWVRKDGEIRHVIMFITPLVQNDLSAGVTFAVLDITDSKKKDAELAVRTNWFLFGSAVFIVLLLILVLRLLLLIRQRNIATVNLRKTEEKLSALFSSMTELVVLHELVFDENNKVVDYRILDCNQAFVKFMNMPKADIVNKEAGILYGQSEAPYLYEYAQVALTGNPCAFETYYEAMDRHFMISVVSPHKNHFATITTDITESKNAQQLILSKNRELENYLYVASHDLRSPLVNVQGFSRRLEKQMVKIKEIITSAGNENPVSEIEELIDKDIAKNLDFIYTGVKKMDSLLNGLLQISRTGREPVVPVNVDMKQLLNKVMAAHNFQITELGAEVKIADIYDCYGDESQLNQLFSNIIDNAIKYRHAERPLQIEISAELRKQRVVYCVRDNGIGIAPRHIEKIWDVFYRTGMSQAPGEGLGLSLVKRIVEKHRGRVWVESEENQGSVFFVELPVADGSL
jgi:PAS domain S-box-containing protein